MNGFVPFDPAAREVVSGIALMIAAYAVICGLLAAYATTIFARAASVRRRARALAARLAGSAGAGRRTT
jgi:hypothetical protein